MLRFLGYFATAMEMLGNFHSPHIPPAMGTGLRESAGGGKVGFQESMPASGACGVMGGNGRDRYFEGQKETGMERRVSLIF